MFKHKAHESESESKKTEKTEEGEVNLASNIAKGGADTSSPHTSASHHSVPAGMVEVKELLEKNLKWSQIIYEQNRKINHKLLWAAIASWLRLFIILVPLVLGVLLIPQLIRDYNCLIKGQGCTEKSKASFENMINVLPLDAAQREELQKILK